MELIGPVGFVFVRGNLFFVCHRRRRCGGRRRCGRHRRRRRHRRHRCRRRRCRCWDKRGQVEGK